MNLRQLLYKKKHLLRWLTKVQMSLKLGVSFTVILSLPSWAMGPQILKTNNTNTRL